MNMMTATTLRPIHMNESKGRSKVIQSIICVNRRPSPLRRKDINNDTPIPSTPTEKLGAMNKGTIDGAYFAMSYMWRSSMNVTAKTTNERVAMTLVLMER